MALAADETDWPRIVRLYDALEQLTSSPVVRLNRAVAVSMVDGPAVALTEVDVIAPDLGDFRPLHAVRAELLAQLGDTDAAAAAFLAAAELPGNEAETTVLRARAAAVGAIGAQTEL